MSGVAGFLDAVIEAPVVTSFTNIGYGVRKRLEGWDDPAAVDLGHRTMVITGATSGLGRAAADRLAAAGARLVLLGRDEERTGRARDDLRAASGNDRIEIVLSDMGDLDGVAAAADEIEARFDSLDVLIHNAGALSPRRRVTAAGHEQTVASQVVGPHLLTRRLLPLLRAAAPGRVLTMSSGGMYSAPLTVSKLEMDDASYRGAEQYARAKRAQVTLNEMWAARVPQTEVVFHALHPGWADTPGVEEALPTFRRIVGPLLRTPAQGADTLVWLAAAGEAERMSGGFWLDRRPRSIHKLPTTWRSDTPERRQKLWDWVEARLA